MVERPDTERGDTARAGTERAGTERAGTEQALARRLRRVLEPVHAVIYGAGQVRAAADAQGLGGPWTAYVAMRAAPLGEAGAAAVRAAFFAFHADRIERVIPDSYAYATPAQALAARIEGVDAALRALWGPGAGTDRVIAEAAELATVAAAAADTDGRVLAAANQALGRPLRAHVALWQAATTLREHRGDGHHAALVTRGVTPVAAHLLVAAAGRADADELRRVHGWPAATWDAEAARLRKNGWVADDGSLTTGGHIEVGELEAATDRAAAAPWRELGADATERLVALVEPLAAAIVEAGVARWPQRADSGAPGSQRADSGAPGSQRAGS